MSDKEGYDFRDIARSARTKCVIEMALDFTAMTRKFAKGSSPRIRSKLEALLDNIGQVHDQATYDRIHSEFCIWFTQDVRIAERKVGKKVERTILAHASSFGHAAKVLDIAAKVYVYYCSLPSPEVAEILLPLLNGGLDNQIISDLIQRFPDSGITSENLEDVDRLKYERLQSLVRERIREDFRSSIHPVQYDDILFRKLNRPTETEFKIALDGARKIAQTVIPTGTLSESKAVGTTD
jgi:hypothetical protein